MAFMSRIKLGIYGLSLEPLPITPTLGLLLLYCLTDAGQNHLPNVLSCKMFSALQVLTIIVYQATPKLQCQLYILPPQHTPYKQGQKNYEC